MHQSYLSEKMSYQKHFQKKKMGYNVTTIAEKLHFRSKNRWVGKSPWCWLNLWPGPITIVTLPLFAISEYPVRRCSEAVLVSCYSLHLHLFISVSLVTLAWINFYYDGCEMVFSKMINPKKKKWNTSGIWVLPVMGHVNFFCFVQVSVYELVTKAKSLRERECTSKSQSVYSSSFHHMLFHSLCA